MLPAAFTAVLDPGSAGVEVGVLGRVRVPSWAVGAVLRVRVRRLAHDLPQREAVLVLDVVAEGADRR